ncbi:MAG: hypothetical protein CM1200mP40_29610 [Gammaproteobacteria bacterium]|nr:MAG: hypothetical protein CM1200mP40_29610 [Gammaproteobacteria bacterium]
MIHPIPAFSDNYIWALLDADQQHACVVDPGDAIPVIDYLEANGLTLTDIFITHHHPDHTGGLKNPLISNTRQQFMVPNPSGIQGISDFLHEGDTATLFGHLFLSMKSRAHS